MRIIVLLFVCFISIPELLAQNEEELPQVSSANQLLYDKIDSQQRLIDSLTLLLVRKNDDAEITINLEDEYDDKELVSVGKMALRFDQTVFFTGNIDRVDDIRAFFLPRFAANMVTVRKGGEGEIALVTHENFDEFARDKLLLEETRYKILNIDFLDVEVIGDRFTITYKTKVEYFVEGEHSTDQSILSTLTGRKRDGLWKIGSYFRTTFEYNPK